MPLDGATATISSRMKATLENTSYVYTGNTTGKVKKSDIKLVDKSTGVDLSNYLDVDSNGYVKVEFTSQDNTAVGKMYMLRLKKVSLKQEIKTIKLLEVISKH